MNDVTVGKLLLELAADYRYVPDQVIHGAPDVATSTKDLRLDQ